MSVREIGCCGTYCKTCIQWQKTKHPNERICQGCKLGYDTRERDITKAKCEIKICCFGKHKLETCADCPHYPCPIPEKFYGKNGYKYKQYQKQLEYVKQHGYEEFLKRAEKWNGPKGNLSFLSQP
ncbi:MAG: DUF3795 domain-containing protein [Candidatus Bathyarchaeia archaeon]